MKTKSLIAIIIGAALLLQVRTPASNDNAQNLLPTITDGQGTVKMIWPPPEGKWPAGGYVVERMDPVSGKSAIVASGILPAADKALLKGLPEQQSGPVAKFANMERKTTGENDQDYQGAKGFLFMSAVLDYRFALAMGVACEDQPPAGTWIYSLKDSGGTVYAVSQPIDVSVATPPSAAPTNLTVDPTPEGVNIDWDNPKPVKEAPVPVVAFRVKRDDGSGFKLLGKGPILMAGHKERRKEGLPRFTDSTVSADGKVSYTVVGLDIFGRETEAATPVSVYVPDYTASHPPKGLKAKVEQGKILLSWKPLDNSRTAGYIIERSNFEAGPYVELTKSDLSKGTSTFTDNETQPGQRYYYRITSQDNKGHYGTPSSPVMAVGKSSKALTAPGGLHATLGAGRITVEWNSVPGAAGYQIERSGGDSGKWSPASKLLATEPRFEDPVVSGQSGVLHYRVKAYAADNMPGDVSDVLDVALPGDKAPSAPQFSGFDGSNGQVVLRFEPKGDTKAVAGYYILRSDSLAAPQEVLQVKPLPPSARTYTDTTVVGGSQYVYRVVAVDGSMNHSEASRPVTVLVGETILSVPPTPTALYTEKDFPKVTITFQPPTGMNLTFIQRKLPGENAWRKVAGPIVPGTNEASDLTPPPSGEAMYRIYYQTPRGTPGPPSETVTVKIGK